MLLDQICFDKTDCNIHVSTNPSGLEMALLAWTAVVKSYALLVWQMVTVHQQTVYSNLAVMLY